MPFDNHQISAHASGDIVWIDMMAVPKSERGKGTGRATYTHWEESLPPDVTRVQIFASDTGAGPSAKFWEKMGFSYQYEGENLDYESANRMWKGVNGHATPPTVNVDDEDEEERLAMEAMERSENMTGVSEKTKTQEGLGHGHAELATRALQATAWLQDAHPSHRLVERKTGPHA